MKWFARGRLWESPEEAQAARRAPKALLEKRGRDWRPGGEHRNPRERFKKRPQPPRVGRRITHGAAYEATAPDSADFLVSIGFDDLAGLQAYLRHPAHEELAVR